MKDKINLLRRRRERSQKPNFSICCIWTWAFITINLIVIALFLLDGPVASYAQHNAQILKPIGSTITDFGKSDWIIFGSLFIFAEALVAYKLSPTLKGRFQAAFIGHMSIYIFLCVSLSGILANLLKRIIGRARPTLYDELGFLSFDTLAGSSRFESFPSGHATTAGALMMAMALIAPSYRLLFLSMALWLGFSRVIVGAHYPSDVIAGLALGAWFSLATAIVFARHKILFRQTTDGMPVLKYPLPLTLMPSKPQYSRPQFRPLATYRALFARG